MVEKNQNEGQKNVQESYKIALAMEAHMNKQYTNTMLAKFNKQYHRNWSSDCSSHTALIRNSINITILLQHIDGLSIMLPFWRTLRTKRTGVVTIVVGFSLSSQGSRPTQSIGRAAGHVFARYDLTRLLADRPDRHHTELLRYWEDARRIRHGQSEATRNAAPFRTQNRNVGPRLADRAVQEGEDKEMVDEEVNEDEEDEEDGGMDLTLYD